eukprot:s482_g4.t1
MVLSYQGTLAFPQLIHLYICLILVGPEKVRMALDRRNYRQLVDTTVEIANKVGGADIIGRIVEDLKDASEPYRKMVMETIDKVIGNLGVADIDSRLEEQIIDGIVYAFQVETTGEQAERTNARLLPLNSIEQLPFKVQIPVDP